MGDITKNRFYKIVTDENLNAEEKRTRILAEFEQPGSNSVAATLEWIELKNHLEQARNEMVTQLVAEGIDPACVVKLRPGDPRPFEATHMKLNKPLPALKPLRLKQPKTAFSPV